MMIIVDGPDGAGKSTLITALTSRLRRNLPGEAEVEVLHARAPQPDVHALDEYVRPLLGYRPGSNQHVLCDRWHVGECVYPRVYDRPTTLDAAVHAYVEMFLAARGALVVYLLPPGSTITHRLAKRVDEGGELGEVPPVDDVLRYFSRAYYLRRTVTIRMVHGTYDPDKLAADLVEVADRVEEDVLPISGYRTYVGPPGVQQLLVGDVRSREAPVDDMFPAFGPYPGTSGHYLLSALHDVPIGLINANDVDPIGSFIDEIEPSQVCALGRRAYRKLQDIDVRCGAVPHPQYVRRFFHHNLDDYRKLIQDTLVTGRNNISWRPARREG